MSETRTRFDLRPEDIPPAWFNLMPDIVGAGMQPLPPLSPATKERLACVNTSTEAISEALEGDTAGFALMAGDAMLTFQLP